MKAEIINIGDEMLIGQVVNTNAAWMAEQLTLAGIELLQITTIADQRKQILSTLHDAFQRAELILITGGLGPTNDDITKEVLCEFFHTALVFNQEVFEQMEQLFSSRKLAISELNRKQAEVPANCIPLKNIHGTAPGMWFEHEGKVLVSLPGVPYEMEALMSNHILPKLAGRVGKDSILHKTILTQGMPESQLAEILANWEAQLPSNFKLAYLPKPGIVRLRVTTKGQNKSELGKEMDRQLEKLQHLIPDLIYGYGDDLLEAIVGTLLLEKNKTLSTAESCTGGYIAHLITSIPGSSQYFSGSVVAYQNSIKEKILGVKQSSLTKYGAVSEQVVKEMALGVQKLYDTDYAIAVSGIAGPDGGSSKKPVGTTWIAIAMPEGKLIALKYAFGEHRIRNIQKAAITALNMLRKALK